jgi:hypothetical protein
MSSKEMRRAGILARVESGELKLVNAAVMMGLSYRQSKRPFPFLRKGDISYVVTRGRLLMSVLRDQKP